MVEGGQVKMKQTNSKEICKLWKDTERGRLELQLLGKLQMKSPSRILELLTHPSSPQP
jgi:hypothetical protein